MEEIVFLIGIMYPFGELNIMGIFTDKKMLIEAYDKLLREDARCTSLKHCEIPQIYKIPLNKFLGVKEAWAKMNGKSYFYSGDNIEAVTVEEFEEYVNWCE